MICLKVLPISDGLMCNAKQKSLQGPIQNCARERQFGAEPLVVEPALRNLPTMFASSVQRQIATNVVKVLRSSGYLAAVVCGLCGSCYLQLKVSNVTERTH